MATKITTTKGTFVVGRAEFRQNMNNNYGTLTLLELGDNIADAEIINQINTDSSSPSINIFDISGTSELQRAGIYNYLIYDYYHEHSGRLRPACRANFVLYGTAVGKVLYNQSQAYTASLSNFGSSGTPRVGSTPRSDYVGLYLVTFPDRAAANGLTYLVAVTALTSEISQGAAINGVIESGLTLADFQAIMTVAGLDVIESKSWPGPSSGTGGTGGDFDDSTDSVAIPSLPTVAPAVSSNFITIYHPTMSELEQIGTVLWSSTISAAIKNLFSDPINAIISLHQTPFPLSTATQKTEWYVGLVGTGVSMNKVTQQYLQYDFGSVDITEYWGNALDYSPYTKAQIYLPYIGIKDLDIDDIMASTVRVVYHVDILTGTCVAYIIVTKKDERSPLYDTPTVMYQFTGNCNLMIPYTGADYSALVQNIITLAGAAVAAGATGGLSTQVTGADAIMGASTAMQSVGAVSGSKPTLLRGGQTGGVAGALGVQNCAIYLTRPNQSLAEDYASERGYPSNITATLGDLTGFTAVESCHVGISGATDEELAEIENFLKSGVIL